MSLIALSNRTLSGCSLFLVIGSAYLWRRKPQEESKRAAAATSERRRITRKCIICGVALSLRLQSRIAIAGPGVGAACPAVSTIAVLGVQGRLAQFHHGGGGVRGVKHGRPCDDPITARTDHFGHVFQGNSTVDLDGERKPAIAAEGIQA